MRIQAAPADVRIARIAARQHGAVSTAQLAVAGVDSAAIARRLRSGRLHRVHRGVYAVGHPSLARGGSWMAAVLACGPRAVLSHRSAAQLWGLLPPGPGPIDVTIAGGGGRLRLRGVRRHRSRSLTPDDVGRRLGIPVTALERTISDLRRIASAAETRRAIRQAAVIGFEIPKTSSPTAREASSNVSF